MRSRYNGAVFNSITYFASATSLLLILIHQVPDDDDDDFFLEFMYFFFCYTTFRNVDLAGRVRDSSRGKSHTARAALISQFHRTTFLSAIALLTFHRSVIQILDREM